MLEEKEIVDTVVVMPLWILEMSNRRPLEKILWEEQDGLCYYCNKPMRLTYGYPDSMTRDHRIPKSKGLRLLNNIVLACYRCNQQKADTVPTDLVDYLDPKKSIPHSGRFELIPNKGWIWVGPKIISFIKRQDIVEDNSLAGN